LRVFLYAPREDKVRRLMARGKSEKEAEELVDTVDHERADFIQKYFNVAWPDRPIYHTMLNTAIGDECVANMILSLVHTYEARCTPSHLFRNSVEKFADASAVTRSTGL